MTRKSSNHCAWHTKQLDSCFNLITSHQQRILWSPHWKSNQQPQNAEPKLYHWATGPHCTQVIPNKLVTVNVRRINLCLVSYIHTLYKRHGHLQSHNFLRGLEIRIYLIITSWYPWSLLPTSPYRSSLPAGPQGCTSYPHRAAVCRFEVVALLLLGHVKGPTGIHHLWARPYFSISVLHVCFV